MLQKFKTIILVQGCFWHGHQNCKDFAIPKSNQEYWIPKIEKNIRRDEDIKSQLEQLGYEVIIAWECDVKQKNNNQILNKIRELLLSKNKF